MNNKNDDRIGGLPKNINKIVSEGNSNAKSIQALIKESGEVTGYELSNGERISKNQGIEMARKGEISGVGVSVSKNGDEYLRSLPDQDENNNLSSLPTIK